MDGIPLQRLRSVDRQVRQTFQMLLPRFFQVHFPSEPASESCQGSTERQLCGESIIFFQIMLREPRLHVLIRVRRVSNVEPLTRSHARVECARLTLLLSLQPEHSRCGRHIDGVAGEMRENAQDGRKARTSVRDVGRVVCDQRAEATCVGRFKVVVETEGGGVTECCRRR